jgi:hypothetical protein
VIQVVGDLGIDSRRFGMDARFAVRAQFGKEAASESLLSDDAFDR